MTSLSGFAYLAAIATIGILPLRAQTGHELRAEPARVLHDTRGGGAHSFSLASSILGETRFIDIRLPASFTKTASSRRYPVIVVLDGETSLAPTAVVADELIRNGQIPEVIVVAVENTNRLRDLTPPGLSVSGSTTHEGGDRFLDFIETELLPAIDRQFRGGLPRVLVGYSSGAILATYAAATRSTYAAVVSIDAPVTLGESWLAKKLIARTSAAPSSLLRYASYEARYGWTDDTWAALEAKAPRAWTLHREHLPLEAHETVEMLATYLGVREVFKDYSRLAAPMSPTTAVLAHYDTVSAAWGVPLAPPSRVLRDAVDDFLMEGDGKAARSTYRTLVASYGAPADSLALSTSIADVERLPAPSETVDELLQTPFPTPEQASAYVGDWVGDSWMTADQPRTGGSVLRIRVDSGRVIGEWIRQAAPPELRVKRVDYLRVTSRGLTFGILNGMRPRAVMLYEGVVHADTLAGIPRFGGTSFKEPDGLRSDPGFLLIRHRP